MILKEFEEKLLRIDNDFFCEKRIDRYILLNELHLRISHIQNDKWELCLYNKYFDLRLKINNITLDKIYNSIANFKKKYNCFEYNKIDYFSSLLLEKESENERK